MKKKLNNCEFSTVRGENDREQKVPAKKRERRRLWPQAANAGFLARYSSAF